jgi:hypothetical protein
MKFLSKNGILIMVIVILLFVSVITMYIKHTEKFSETASSNKCEWEPYGITEFDCINSCVARDDIYGCDPSSCVTKCQECSNSNKCTWLKKSKDDSIHREQPTISADVSECAFNPYGKTYKQCRKHCSQRSDKVRYGGSNCNELACAELCYTCDNNDWCEWINRHGVEAPSSTILFGNSGYNQFTLFWDDIPNVTYFVIICYERDNPDESLRVEKIFKEKIYEKHAGKIKHIIKDVEDDIFYNFYILCANDNGLSLASNTISMKLTQVSNVFKEEKRLENNTPINNIVKSNICKKYNYQDISREFLDLVKDKNFTINLR